MFINTNKLSFILSSSNR